MPESRYHAVLFDLDGTLADTAADLAGALNRQRQRHGLAPLPFEQLRPHASHGARGLLAEGFGVAPEDARFAELREEFLALYAQALCVETHLFRGADALLNTLEARGLRWGIVTNKVAALTHPLLELLGLAQRAGCVVCGDTTPHPKPHPEPLLHAARSLAVPASACLYVGDGERDMQAARDAGMAGLVARYGYIAGHEQPETWPALGIIDAVGEVLEHLD
ncbi:N-acetyl-D-muramate 6-phosphate phosphatase [Burkholderiales bacterium]|nr:MAG: HAD-IA family hydrolase [Burkholderiales bacterium]CAG0952313.1 N-acetyl-D-muramate 6-phosphate phosphatase [Burkholderiales bacterium]